MNELDRTTFNKMLDTLAKFFEFSRDTSLEYDTMVFDALQAKISEEMFIKTCKDILETTSKDEWNKAYGFKGRPALKDWIDAFVPKMQVVGRKKCKITGQLVDDYQYPENYKQFLNQISKKQLT